MSRSPPAIVSQVERRAWCSGQGIFSQRCRYEQEYGRDQQSEIKVSKQKGHKTSLLYKPNVTII